MATKFSKFSNLIPYSPDTILFAPNNYWYSDPGSFIWKFDVKSGSVKKFIEYPEDLEHESCYLAYDDKGKALYLLQSGEAGPINIYKIDLKQKKWIKLNKF